MRRDGPSHATRLTLAAIGATAALEGCHSVAISIERQDNLAFPGANAYHVADSSLLAVSLPAAPFVNWFRGLGPGPSADDPARNFVDYFRDSINTTGDACRLPFWLCSTTLDQQVAAARALRKSACPAGGCPPYQPFGKVRPATIEAGPCQGVRVRTNRLDGPRSWLRVTKADGQQEHFSAVKAVADAGCSPDAADCAYCFPGVNAPAPDSHADVITEPRVAESLVSFVQLSDVQIREGQAKLGGRAVSEPLDKLIPSFERNPDQELFSAYVYGSVIAALNKDWKNSTPDAKRTVYRPRPAFMIHTGDAVDAGLVSEFRRFFEVTNELSMPWYQVIGNHDVLAFGNLQVSGAATTVRGQQDEYACTPTAELAKELASDYACLVPLVMSQICLAKRITYPNGELASDGLLAASSIKGFIDQHKEEKEKPLTPCDLTPGDPGSKNHGFDCHPESGTRGEGYYYFRQALPVIPGEKAARTAWFIVLQTSSDKGAYGVFSEAQGNWLENVLRKAAPSDVVFVLGHHPIWGIVDLSQRRRLATTLEAHPQVVAYLAGHTHWPDIRPHCAGDLDRSPACQSDPSLPFKFWEIVAPSVLSFPQEGRVVTLKSLGGDVGFLEVQAVGAREIDRTASPLLTAYLDRGDAGAKQDACHEGRHCPFGQPDPYGQAVTFARLFFRFTPAP